MRTALTILATFSMLAAAPAAAFQKVDDRDRFVGLIQGKELKRFGVTLVVTPEGTIRGRGFGRPVTGAWNWNQGYFCRSLVWGERDLGDNCQEVRVQGETIRFTSDQGAGDFADLQLR